MATGTCSFCGKGNDEFPKCAFCAKPDVRPDAAAKPGTATPSASQPLKSKIPDQVLKQKAPALYELVQKADVTLKRKNLSDHRARVALCLDISGSMSSFYRSGKVQALAERVLALGCRFDDDGAIDIFLFGAGAHEAGSMTLDNFNGFIKTIAKKYPLESDTRYGLAMEMIRKHYFPDAKGQKRERPVKADTPVYVMFITDGETRDKDYTKTQITWAAYEPIFWQFMGLGESRKDVRAKGILGFLNRVGKPDFEFLEQLDEMKGRFVDNANFFSVKDPADITDDDLYEFMMAEYPGWVTLARGKGLL